MSDRPTKEKRVLLITYCFPPAGWVGGYRTLKFGKYLSDHGWTPVVLAAKTTGVAFLDQDLLRDLPAHVRVHRTIDVDPAKWEEKLAAWKCRVSSRRAQSSAASSRSMTRSDDTPHRAPGMWKRLTGFLKTLLTNSPDSHIFWVPSALLRGARILLKEKVDVLYCSSPPHSSHIIAYLLAKCFRKAYILDFRDPWLVIGSQRGPIGTKLSWALKWETLLKRVIVRRAAKVISVSKGERDELRAEFPELNDELFTFITNGYDPTDFTAARGPIPTRSKITLTHAGTIYDGIAGEFFAALQHIVKDHPTIHAKLQIHLVGEIANQYVETTRALEACGVVRAHGLRPHAECLKIVSESDGLIILMGGDKYLPSHIPSKVFEYLQTGKPIFAIANDGELAQIVAKSGLGIVVSPKSVERIVRALLDLCADHPPASLGRNANWSYIRSFERTQLTRKLAVILDEVRVASKG